MDTFCSSEKVKKFVVFSYIKELVNDLSNVYPDEPLTAYKNFVNNTDILSDNIEDFIHSFSNSLTGKHRAKYCDGVYVNIPKFLSYNDDNKDSILQYLDRIKKVSENIDECKEIAFFKEKIQGISNNEISMIQNIEKPSESIFKKILEELAPKYNIIKAEFQEKKLNGERFNKILYVGCYDKISDIDKGDTEDHDGKCFKNILRILANTPHSELSTKTSELFMEATSLKNKGFLNIFTSISGNKV